MHFNGRHLHNGQHVEAPDGTRYHFDGKRILRTSLKPCEKTPYWGNKGAWRRHIKNMANKLYRDAR